MCSSTNIHGRFFYMRRSRLHVSNMFGIERVTLECTRYLVLGTDVCSEPQIIILCNSFSRHSILCTFVLLCAKHLQ